MATVNESIRDAVVRHQIMLLRYARSVEAEVLSLLNATDAAVVGALLGRLGRLADGAAAVDITAPSVRRQLAVLEADLVALRSDALEKVYALWALELGGLAVSEGEFIRAAIVSPSPVLLDLSKPRAAEFRALFAKVPVQGFSARSWLSKLGEDDARRVMQAVRVGLANGRSVQEIARRISGTKAAGYRDGVLQTSRRQATVLTRTLVLETANAARALVVEANADILTEEVYVATLDSRTTPVCRSLDGKRYAIGEGPRPPVHWQCRSTRVPVVDGEIVGVRPAKADSERLFLRDYAMENGLSVVARRRDLPYGHKGKYDAWRRARVREIVGTVPASTTYGQWLSRQTAAFQDDVLGATRGALFRRGGLSLDRFVDSSGRQYTLPELVRRDRQAFLDAGLDPGNFGRASAG